MIKLLTEVIDVAEARASRNAPAKRTLSCVLRTHASAIRIGMTLTVVVGRCH